MSAQGKEGAGHEDSNRDGGGLVATIIASPQETAPAVPRSHITMGVPVGTVVPGHIVTTHLSSTDAMWLKDMQFMKFWLIASVVISLILFFTWYLSLLGPIVAIVGGMIYICPACRCHKSLMLSHLQTIKVFALVSGFIDVVIGTAVLVIAGIVSHTTPTSFLIHAIVTAITLFVHSTFSFMVARRMMFVAKHFNPISSGVVAL